VREALLRYAKLLSRTWECKSNPKRSQRRLACSDQSLDLSENPDFLFCARSLLKSRIIIPNFDWIVILEAFRVLHKLQMDQRSLNDVKIRRLRNSS
jgi:hypothetical protein